MPHAVEAVAAGVADVVLAVAAMWVLGSAAAPRSPSAERLAVGLLLVLGGGWLLMAQPLVRASLLGHPAALRLLVLAAVGVALARRRPRRPERVLPVALAAAVAVGVAVAYPAWRTPTPLLTGSDIQWHEGWIRQLAGGETTPTGLYDGVPNAYPWLYHSLGAGVMQVFAAGMATTLLVLEALLLLALGLGAWVLARELRLSERAAAWAAVLALGGGGLGWLWAKGPAAVLTVGAGGPRNVPAGLAPFRPGAGAYGGDLLLSPGPTPALAAIPPAEPRDLGLALVPLALWLVLRARRRRSPRVGIAAGAAIGIVFLLSPVAAVVTVACALLLSIGAPVRVPVAWAAAAAVVAAVWLAPLAWHYHRLGGFIPTTRAPPLSLDLSQVLVTVALLLVLALVGAVSAATRDGDVDRRAIAVIVAVPLAAYLVSLAGAGGGGSLPALSRSVRYLPLAALGLVVPAAIGAAALVRAARAAAPYAAAVLGAACVASAVTAAVGMSRAEAWSERNPPVACAPAPPLGAGDVLAIVPVRGEDNNAAEAVALSLFAATGSHLYYVPRPRIRYRDMFRHIPRQRDRKQLVLALAAGGRMPPGVTAVMAPAADRVSGGLEQAGTCRLHAFGGGRFSNARYILYRVVR
jgi:hypothetical protein